MADKKVVEMKDLSVKQLQERLGVSEMRARELYALMHGDSEVFVLDDVKPFED